MQVNVAAVIGLVWAHWFADFFWQTDDMAKNKSKSNKWLLAHVTIYAAVMLLWGWKFALINGAAHFATDWITSRWSSKLYAKGDRHAFFVVIGFDQAIHLTTLVLTFRWLVLK